MQLRRKSRMSSEVSTSSLNDIMFFLMLFFLIVATLGTSAIKINLPKTKAGKAVSKQNVVLSVDSNMNYFIDKEPIRFEEIEPRLANYVNPDTSKETNIVLQVSGSVKVQNLVDVMTIGSKLRMKMVLATTPN